MSGHKWTFKSRFRSGAYGWHGTKLASQRMKEAVREIKKAAKTDSALAGEGCIELMARLYPACQYIDTSSGSFGNASNKTIEALIPILTGADWDMNTRGKLLEKLYQAVCDDGWDLLAEVEDRWGEICVYEGLAHLWADRLIPVLKKAWSQKDLCFIRGDRICLSCLLYTQRYDELKELVDLYKYKFWSVAKFWAEALVRQGKIEEAITYAQSFLKDGYAISSIYDFCEKVLLAAGRTEEAYAKFGLEIPESGTYLSVYRSVCAKYPAKDKRQILLDLIEKSGRKGKWFAAAKEAGYLDIALECAETREGDPNTLLRAVRDYAEKEPIFAIHVGIEALLIVLTCEFTEPITPMIIAMAYSKVAAAAQKTNRLDWFQAELAKKVLQNSLKMKPKLREAIMKQLKIKLV
jgi:hypothetical protein